MCSTSTITSTSPGLLPDILSAQNTPQKELRCAGRSLHSQGQSARWEGGSRQRPAPPAALPVRAGGRARGVPDQAASPQWDTIISPAHAPAPSFQVTGAAGLHFSRLFHFWHLSSQTGTPRFPLSPSIWYVGLQALSPLKTITTTKKRLPVI